MTRWITLMLVALTLVLGGAAADSGTAVWVYGAHRWRPATVEARLAQLPEGARLLYLSVEEGPRLVFDNPADAERLTDLLDLGGGRLGLTVDAMLLQDPSWASDPDGAAARVSRVVAFQQRTRAEGRRGFRGLHFDIEPYTTEEWGCGTAGDRRAILRRLQAVFARIRQVVQASGTGLQLSAALPWWVVTRGADFPDAVPRVWLGSLDEIVVMVYGDPGGPLVGESASAVLARVGPDPAWAGLPDGRGFRIGLATYEYPDEPALAASMRRVADGVARWTGFRGVAIFAYGQPFNAPLVTEVQGRVVDGVGRPVAGATVRGNNEQARSSRCGVFELRGLPAGQAQITVEASGFSPASVTVAGLVPGRQREITPITLTPRQASGGKVAP